MGKRFTVDTPMVIFDWSKNPPIRYNKKLKMTDLDGNEFTMFDNPMLDSSISEIEFSSRESRCLRNVNVVSIRDIVERYPEASRMMEIQGIGVTSVSSIYKKLKEWQISVLPDSVVYN